MTYQKISDREGELKIKLGNRTDIDTRVRQWYKEAYTHLAMNYQFEDLEDSIEDLLPVNTDAVDYPNTARAIKLITLTSADGRTVWQPEYKDIRIIRRIPKTSSGPPSVYCPFKNQVLFRPLAKVQYTIIWDIWTKPEIQTTVQDTELRIPDDWLEILDYMVLMRAYMSLPGEKEQAENIRMLLYGDPKQPTEVGLIKALMLRRQAEAPARDYGLRPRKVDYTHVS